MTSPTSRAAHGDVPGERDRRPPRHVARARPRRATSTSCAAAAASSSSSAGSASCSINEGRRRRIATNCSAARRSSSRSTPSSTWTGSTRSPSSCRPTRSRTEAAPTAVFLKRNDVHDQLKEPLSRTLGPDAAAYRRHVDPARGHDRERHHAAAPLTPTTTRQRRTAARSSCSRRSRSGRGPASPASRASGSPAVRGDPRG